jgi:hypothetical protein
MAVIGPLLTIYVNGGLGGEIGQWLATVQDAFNRWNLGGTFDE